MRFLYEFYIYFFNILLYSLFSIKCNIHLNVKRNSNEICKNFSEDVFIDRFYQCLVKSDVYFLPLTFNLIPFIY